MPFLRFNRDKRGYETTALVHAFRRQGRARPSILYWFRSPIDVKVGRSPIDEDAIRLIEEHHPELSFDWPKILESRGLEEIDSCSRPLQKAQAKLPSRHADRSRPAPEAVPIAAVPAGSTTEPSRTIAAEQSFSLEDLTRLRGRYAAVLATIDQRVADPARAAELHETAEVLNPDTWVTPKDVKVALEGYEQTYRKLRDALGSRRRRPAGQLDNGGQVDAAEPGARDDADPA